LHGVQHRSAGAIASFALLAMAAVAAIVLIVQLRRDAIDDAHRDLSNLALVLAEESAKSVQAIDLVLRDLQDTIGAQQGDSVESFNAYGRSVGMRGELLKKRSQLPQADVFTLIDSEGRLLNSSLRSPHVGLDLSDRDYVAHFKTGGDAALFISAPMQNRTNGTWTIFLARRIAGPSGKFLGVVAGGIPIDFLESIYRSIDLPRHETFLLTRRDGTILLRYPDRSKRAGQVIPADSPWHGLVERGGGFYSSPGMFEKITRLIAVHPMTEWPLVVNAGVPEGAVLVTWRRQAIFIGIATAIVLVFAACLIVITRRQFASLAQSRVSLQDRNQQLQQLSDDLLLKKTDLANLTRELGMTLETMDQGLIMVDEHDIVVQCNTRARHLLELPADFVGSRPSFLDVLRYQWETNLSGRDEGTFAEFAESRLVADRPYTRELRRPDGRIVEMRSIPVESGGFVRTYTDITARKNAEEKAQYLAHHDDLTQLINRPAFLARLQEALSMARANLCGMAVMYLDLDRFKEINDTRGHNAGDRVLSEAARRMRACVRSTDTVARLGGDEFAVILPSLDKAEIAIELAERMVSAIGEPFVLDGSPAQVGASIGIALFPQDAFDAGQLLQCADAALYEAKHAGRGGYRLHRPAVAYKPANPQGRLERSQA
jgi:diguanylate cyclase (GGDEF)-like protein